MSLTELRRKRKMRRNEQNMMMDLKSFIFFSLKDSFYLYFLVHGVVFFL